MAARLLSGGTPWRSLRRREEIQGAFLPTAFLAAGSGEYHYPSFGNDDSLGQVSVITHT